MSRTLQRAVVAVAVLASAAAAVVLGNAATAGQQRSADPITMGFYSRWSWSDDHNYLLKDVHESGAADSMTHLAYAFANIDADGACEPETGWGDYTSQVAAGESLDGRADRAEDAVWGQFGQLRKLKELYPDLKVLISLGGGGGDQVRQDFEALAANPRTRAAFVQNCVDTFVRGNLPRIDQGADGVRGGAGAAAGIFDGIDIDWEWAQHPTRENYTALHQEFAAALDETEAELGRELTLSTTFPGFVSEEGDGSNGSRYDGYDVPELFGAVDFAHVQVYMMYAPWDGSNLETAFHSQHVDLDRNPYDLSASGAKGIQYLLDNGAPADKIVYGVPAFGHGWTGVPATGNGVFQPGTGPADTGEDYGALSYDRIVSRTDGEHFFDPDAVSAYYYDGNDWFGYDSVRSVRAKAEFVREKGLGGMMVWELLQNQDGELIRTMAEAQR